METQHFFTFSQENCILEGRVANLIDKSASAFDIYEQIINLDVLIEIRVCLFKKATPVSNKTGGSFAPMPKK